MVVTLRGKEGGRERGREGGREGMVARKAEGHAHFVAITQCKTTPDSIRGLQETHNSSWCQYGFVFLEATPQNACFPLSPLSNHVRNTIFNPPAYASVARVLAAPA